MRIERLGDGAPEVAVVGGIHGDEPCGVAAVTQLIEERPPVDRPVALIVANELAVQRGERYIETDLNRAFPGNPAGVHEEQLAARLDTLLEDVSVLALHSTQSHDEPFAVIDEVTERTRRICRRLPIDAVVESGSFVEGRLFASADVIEVECGRQWSAAATRNAHDLARSFLAAEGVLADPQPTQDHPVYRIRDRVPKRRAAAYDVHVENFSRVASGEVFATVDGEPVRAEDPFYPILMSPEGYDEVFGYAADRVGKLS